MTVEACCAIRYTMDNMIKDFKHKGLRLFFETEKTSGIQPQHAKRLRLQLIALHTANKIEDMDVPGYRLHRLKGQKQLIWSITVNKNWRLTFEYREGDVFLLNYEDYH